MVGADAGRGQLALDPQGALGAEPSPPASSTASVSSESTWSKRCAVPSPASSPRPSTCTKYGLAGTS